MSIELADIISYVDDLKWPVVVLICFAVVIFAFKKQVEDFLGRVHAVGKDGLKATPITRPEQQARQGLELQKKQRIHELSKAFDSPIVREQEKRIKAELQEKQLECSGDSIDILVTHLANVQMELRFEQIYNAIFGSQIFLLKELNMRNVIAKPEMEAHFQHVKKHFEPHLNDWEMEAYLFYLFSNQLLSRNDTSYSLTPLGKEFLTWIIKRGYSESNPL